MVSNSAASKTATRMTFALLIIMLGAGAGLAKWVDAKIEDSKKYTEKMVSDLPQINKSVTTIEINLRTLMHHQDLEYQEAK